MSDGTAILLIVLVVGVPAAGLFLLMFKREWGKSRPQFGKKNFPNGTMEVGNIYVGPRLPKRYGGDKSPGVPLHPLPHPEGFALPIPQRSSHEASGDRLNYVGFRLGPHLGDKARLILRGRIEMGPDVEILAHNSDPKKPKPGMLTMFFQVADDDWSGSGKLETARWYSDGARLAPLQPGEFELIAPLDANLPWNATRVSTSLSNPEGFRKALAKDVNIGFVAGGGESFAHGFYATGPARLVITFLGAE